MGSISPGLRKTRVKHFPHQPVSSGRHAKCRVSSLSGGLAKVGKDFKICTVSMTVTSEKGTGWVWLSAFIFTPAACLHPQLNFPMDKVAREVTPHTHISLPMVVASKLQLQYEEKGKGSALKVPYFWSAFLGMNEPGTPRALADLVTTMRVVVPHSPSPPSETPVQAETAKAILNFWMLWVPGLTQLCNYFIQLGPQGELSWAREDLICRWPRWES